MVTPFLAKFNAKSTNFPKLQFLQDAARCSADQPHVCKSPESLRHVTYRSRESRVCSAEVLLPDAELRPTNRCRYFANRAVHFERARRRLLDLAQPVHVLVERGRRLEVHAHHRRVLPALELRALPEHAARRCAPNLGMSRCVIHRANFGGLVLGCIEAKFCKKICV